VYGEGVEVPITEQTPPRPNCPYGESKLMSEQVVRAYAKSNPEFQSVILRYFNGGWRAAGGGKGGLEGKGGAEEGEVGLGMPRPRPLTRAAC
jgi:UDP-glucose 4-epimerase